MYSFNKGEWSEIYTVLFLLKTPELNIVDSNLNSINKTIHTIKEIVLDGKIKLEYKISGNDILFYTEKRYIKNFTKYEIEEEKNKILNEILKNATRIGAFSLKNANSFISDFTLGNSFKGKSLSKADLKAIVHDNLKDLDVNLCYSIKSQLGSPSTILNSSNNTNFRYEIVNFPISKIDLINSINTRTKLIDRIKAVKEYNNVEIKFDSVLSKILEKNLRLVDSLMPEYIANTLLYSYE